MIALRAAGVSGVAEVQDKIVIVTNGTAGVDTVGMMFTPLDLDFCNRTLSMAEYLILAPAITNSIRKLGASFLFSSSYVDHLDAESNQTMSWADGAPDVCESMLRCSQTHNVNSTACAVYEHAAEDFLNDFTTPEVQNHTRTILPNLGRPGADAGQCGL